MAAAFEIETRIEAPPAQVFAVATDIERVPEWMSAVEALEPLDEGPVREGWRFRERSGQAAGTRVPASVVSRNAA